MQETCDIQARFRTAKYTRLPTKKVITFVQSRVPISDASLSSQSVPELTPSRPADRHESVVLGKHTIRGTVVVSQLFPCVVLWLVFG